MANTKKKIKKLIKKSKTELFYAKTVFPFDIVPDEITIDMYQVTIIKRGLLSSQTFPIIIENINGARAYHSLLLSTLKIEISGYEKNPGPLKHLLPKDAKAAKDLILGLVIAKREGIDLSKLKKEEIKENVLKIGQSGAV